MNYECEAIRFTDKYEFKFNVIMHTTSNEILKVCFNLKHTFNIKLED